MMQIPLSNALIPEHVVVNCLLPNGYSATLHDGKYLVSNYVYLVATAVVQDQMIRFDFLPGQRGEEFKKKLYAIHPEYDPDRLVWVVFYKWHGAYTFVGHGLGHDTADEALDYVTASHIDKHAILCLVRLSDIFSDDGRGDEFVTTSAFPIRMDLTLEPDLGPTKIVITHLELGKE